MLSKSKLPRAYARGISRIRTSLARLRRVDSIHGLTPMVLRRNNKSFIYILADRRRAVLFILFGTAAFFLLIFLSRFNFIMKVTSNHAGFSGSKIKLFADAWYWSLKDISPLQLIINGFASLLFGMNAVIILYLIRIHRATLTSAMSLLSMGAFASALLGLWCISCGSLFIMLIPSLFSVSFLFLLPFHGLEFSILSIIFLCISLWLSYKNLSRLTYR